MRTKVAIPNTLHQKVKRIADKIDLPVGTLISLMISDILLNRTIKPEKEDTAKESKNNVEMNLTFNDDFYYGVMLEVISQEKGYTVRELAIDCINAELGQFESFIYVKNLEFAKQNRIRNTGKECNKTYTPETLEKNKAIPPIEEYIKKKAECFGIGVTSIKKFYIAKEVNRIIGTYEEEYDIFSIPEKFE